MSYLLGKALLDYLEHQRDTEIITLNSFGDEEIVPVSYFFRSYKEMPALEQRALDLARGSVLDIGAGAGSHCLYLLQKGLDVTALDPSPEAINCCQRRGIHQTFCGRIQEFSNDTYDTLLLLMNGIGLAGSLAQLDALFHHMGSLLKPGGQILLDSSDIRYMYDTDASGNPILPKEHEYYGNILFSVYYQGEIEPPWPWVYVDYDALAHAAERAGLVTEKIIDGPHFDYLARLTRG